MSCMTRGFTPGLSIDDLKQIRLTIITYTPLSMIQHSANWIIPHEFGHIFNSALWINAVNRPDVRWRNGCPEDISLSNATEQIEQLAASDTKARKWIVNAYSEAFTDGIGVQIAEKFGVPLSLQSWNDESRNLLHLGDAFASEVTDLYGSYPEHYLRYPSWELYSFIKDRTSADCIREILNSKISANQSNFNPFAQLPTILSPSTALDISALSQLFKTAFLDGYALDLRPSALV